MQVSKQFKVLVLFACLGLTESLVSQAALFDDTEARKRILEVETKATADHESQQHAIDGLNKAQKALEKRIQGLEAQVNAQALLDMQNQLDQIKQDLAQLKGDLEVATHGIQEAQQKQNESYIDLDARLKRLESTSAPAANQAQAGAVVSEAEAAALQQESKSIADADALSQAGKYKEAFEAYDAFLKAYSGSKHVPEALYGLGFSQYGLKNYKSSIATQQKFIDNYAAHALAPNAMMNMANSQIQLGQVAVAKKTLKDLIAAYPAAEVTPTAQKRLKMLEALK